MSNILDQVARPKPFVPATTDEYMALQLAKRLSDEPAIGRYLQYVSHYPVLHLMHNFHRAKRTVNPALTFHSSLKPTNS